jgi:hypothetical protein
MYDQLFYFYNLVPQQYRLLTLLYIGFLGTVLLMNILALIFKWILQWALRR